MKLINKLIITYRFLKKRWFVSVLLVLICLLSFYLSDKVFFGYYNTYNNILHEKNAYSVNPYNVNKITFSVRSNPEDGYKVLDIIDGISEINVIGRMSGNSVVSMSTEEVIDTIVCDYNFSTICNIKVSEEVLEKINKTDLDFEYILLGNSFKGKYNINDRFMCSSKNGNIECVVAGFLDDGAQFLLNSTNSIDYYNLDKCGIILTRKFDELFCFDMVTSFVSPVYYSCDEKDRTDVEDKIKDMLQKEGINAAITNEGEDVENRISEISVSADKEFMAALMLFFISIISISTVNVVECMINKKDYALLMICGCRYFDIYSLIAIKNFIIVFIAGLAAYLYSQFMIFGSLMPNSSKFMIEYYYLYAQKAHCVDVPLVLVTEAIFMLSISCLIPILIIRKSKIIDMMKK